MLTYKGNSITLTQTQANPSGTLPLLARTHTNTAAIHQQAICLLDQKHVFPCTNQPVTFIKLRTAGSSRRPDPQFSVSGTRAPVPQAHDPPETTPPATLGGRADTSRWTAGDAPVAPPLHAN